MRTALVVLALLLVASACDTQRPDAPEAEAPDLPIVTGRFDGPARSEAEDYTLRLYLEERPGPDGAAIQGLGGALYAGSSPWVVGTTSGRREGGAVRFVATLRSGGTVGFTGTVGDGGRTLTGVVAGETRAGPFGPVGIVLEWQDLNYGR